MWVIRQQLVDVGKDPDTYNVKNNAYFNGTIKGDFQAK